ncbi:hypothetical protein EK21DRAFT_108094 [Setomelanomma holmii]|uniref:Glucose-methanol-choline oxidoreductase N-terminal domain-containing protein n=1 Tax=Setomelanomma holmii TaxID=210430 RepID=A0A9P4HJQ7_9PLEO|nr:hypothetical protein EK21DRAFT_108094 [Setomelanomma holmii]
MLLIGGGTGGLAIASCLATFASVAVVEAGGLYEQDNGNQFVVPYYGLVMLVLGTTEDYPCPPPIDWDLSYIFDKLLPHFKKTSTLTPPNLAKRNAPNATIKYDPAAFDNSLRGPLHVSWANWVDPTQSWLALALQAVGMTLSPVVLSSGQINGGAWVPTTIDPKDGTRSTSKSSYLDSLSGPKPIVYLRSQASKITFERTKKATGVIVSTNGTNYLLMLSGSGPASSLASHGTPVISDLTGVGQNLWDQIFFNVLRDITVPNTGTYLSTPAQQAFAGSQYLINTTGPYSSAGGYLSFEKLPASYRKNLSA